MNELEQPGIKKKCPNCDYITDGPVVGKSVCHKTDNSDEPMCVSIPENWIIVE